MINIFIPRLAKSLWMPRLAKSLAHSDFFCNQSYMPTSIYAHRPNLGSEPARFKLPLPMLLVIHDQMSWISYFRSWISI
jgi:hypothetical protein